MAEYTSGDWHVKAGKEREFVEAWRELADWVGSEFDRRGRARLWQDRDDPAYFRSVGEWADTQTMERARASEGFKQRLTHIGELVSDWHIYTMDVVADAQGEPFERPT
jgi:quinol monooxygenase YgiN